MFSASKARRARVAWRVPASRQSRPLVRTKRESARLERASRFSRSRKSLWLGSGWPGSDPRQTPDDKHIDAVFARHEPELSHQRCSPTDRRLGGAALPCSCNAEKRDYSDCTPTANLLTVSANKPTFASPTGAPAHLQRQGQSTRCSLRTRSRAPLWAELD